MCSGCGWLDFWSDDESEVLDDLEPLTFGDGTTGPLPGDIGLENRFSIDERKTDPAYQVDPVYFSYDSFQVQSSELSKIERVAEMMRGEPGLTLVTEGHCDERGSNEYNMSLGEHRALAIRANLVTLGIDGSRIQTRSYGEEQPADPGHSEASWRMNRRVEFVFY